jgi:NADPH-dependent 2,4-dienoyl-CoA reductase/sulfur reductase-like enzyme
VQLGTHANKQGKVAGIDIAAHPDDGDATFPGVVGTAVTRVCQWDVARVGLTERRAHELGIDAASVSFSGTAKAGYMPEPGTVHVRMLAERGTGRVLGAQLVGSGNGSVAKRIDVAAVWCQLGVRVQDAQFLDLSYAPPFGGVWDLLLVAARKLTRELDLAPQL